MNTNAITMFESTVKYNGDHIFVKPFCDFFQIDYLNQRKNINNNPLLQRFASKKKSPDIFGDERERVCLSKQGFITWILQINPQLVEFSLRERLYEYQSLIFDFMFGSINREKEIRTKYNRLKKLKRLKITITEEIKKCEREISNYLDDRFIQHRLNFDQPKEIGQG